MQPAQYIKIPLSKRIFGGSLVREETTSFPPQRDLSRLLKNIALRRFLKITFFGNSRENMKLLTKRKLLGMIESLNGGFRPV